MAVKSSIGFLLVFDQRILLPVRAVADALLQLVHRQQVVFPLVVDHLQHHDALGLAHHVRAHQVFLLLVPALQLVEDGVRHLLAVQIAQLLEIDLVAELRQDIVAQRGQVPGVGMLVVGAVAVDVLAR